MNFSSWILSIVGAVILTVLVDIVLPDGSTNKYIKGVSSLIVLYMIVSPFPQLVGRDFDFKFTQSDTSLNANYLETVFDMRCQLLEEKIVFELENNGIYSAEIKIIAINKNSNADIQIIEVNISKAVIQSSIANINIKDKIKSLICKIVNISEDKVMIYG